jgi:hypothetical protein
MWEWDSKDDNSAPVGRHVHWDFDKTENKDIYRK